MADPVLQARRAPAGSPRRGRVGSAAAPAAEGGAAAAHPRRPLPPGRAAGGASPRRRVRHQPGAGARGAARARGDRPRHQHPAPRHLCLRGDGRRPARDLRRARRARGAGHPAGHRRAAAATSRRCRRRSTPCARAALAGDVHGVIEHSVAFHRAIMEAAGNRLLLNIWLSLQIETRTTITMLVEGLDLVEIADSHQPIVDAIAGGDAGARRPRGARASGLFRGAADAGADRSAAGIRREPADRAVDGQRPADRREGALRAGRALADAAAGADRRRGVGVFQVEPAANRPAGRRGAGRSPWRWRRS